MTRTPHVSHSSDVPDALVALTVGNSRTRVGVLRAGEVYDVETFPSTDHGGAATAALRLVESSMARGVVIASVHDARADQIESLLTQRGSPEVFRIGRDLKIPIRHTLNDAKTVGHDRLLCALGAFSKSKQACVVVDAGTAITVDFVDGEGTFQGGVIAPGCAMMLRALHAGTAALPEVAFGPPTSPGAYGKDTKHAMVLGVRNAAIGLVRYTVETFALAYEAYPQIIATGGDALSLFADDEIVEHVVPDLQMVGIAEAFRLIGAESAN